MILADTLFKVRLFYAVLGSEGYSTNIGSNILT